MRRCLFINELKSHAFSLSPHIQKWIILLYAGSNDANLFIILCVCVVVCARVCAWLGEIFHVTVWFKAAFCNPKDRTFTLFQLRPGFCSKCFCQSGFFALISPDFFPSFFLSDFFARQLGTHAPPQAVLSHLLLAETRRSRWTFPEFVTAVLSPSLNFNKIFSTDLNWVA